jgi:hypothetical protein
LISDGAEARMWNLKQKNDSVASQWWGSARVWRGSLLT